MNARLALLAVLASSAGFAFAAEQPATSTNDVVGTPATAPDAPLPPVQIATDRISVLYRRETLDAPERLDPAVQAATAAMEKAFVDQGYKVIQPLPAVYRLLDQGPGMIVTFARDAGLSLVFSVYRNLRPIPGTQTGIAELRIDARVFVGRTMLALEQGRGQLQTRTDPGFGDYGARRGYEVAAQKAASMLAPLVTQRLRGISAEQLASYADFQGASATGEQVIAPPPAPLAPQAAPTPVAPNVVAAAPVPPPPPSQQANDALSVALATPRNRWALLVGVSDYSSVYNGKIGNLKGVATDMRKMREILLSRGFAAERIIDLREAKATSGNVRGALKALATATQTEDLVVMFISAHGRAKDLTTSGYGMPILSDFNNSYADLDFWEIQSLTRNLPAKQVVWIIDTCHAGGATVLLPTVVVSSSSIALDASNGRPNVDAIRAGMGDRHFAVMSAARADETSLDLGATYGGLFTMNLIRGLSRASEARTIEELFRDDVFPQVTRFTEDVCQRLPDQCSRQTPMFGYDGSGNRIRL